MIWYEFLRRFKPKAITTLWVFGPILLYELFGRALEYFRIPPIGIREDLMAVIAILLVLALACWLWVVGEWAWFSSRAIRIFSRKLCRFARERLRCGKHHDKFNEKFWKEGKQCGQQLKRDKPFDPWAQSGRDVTVWEPSTENIVRLGDPVTNNSIPRPHPRKSQKW